MKSSNTKETVHYVMGQSFLFHHNKSESSYPKHWHDAVEIVMPIKNAYRVDIGRQSFYLNEYDILVIPAGSSHSLYAAEAKGRRIILQFTPEVFITIRGFTDAALLFENSRLFSADGDSETHRSIKQLLLQMLEEHTRHNAYYEIAIRNRIIDIALHLARSCQNEATSSYTHPVKRKEHMDRLNECFDYIYQHSSENLTLEMAAQAAGFSKFYFSRWFRDITGMPFHDYLTKTRIDKAASLLLSTALSITAIALEAGFQCTSTFNRVFKQQNHCTPKEYRNRHKPDTQSMEDCAAVDGDDICKAIYNIKTAAPEGMEQWMKLPGAADTAPNTARSDEFYVPGAGEGFWHWNHPGHELWSLTERPGYLRLRTANLCLGLMDAQNCFSQRASGPAQAGMIALDVGDLRNGDVAGLSAWQADYAYAGVTMRRGTKYIVMAAHTSGTEKEYESIPLSQERVYLRLDYEFEDAEAVRFYYSLDELGWYVLGPPVAMQAKSARHMDYRFTLFYYSMQAFGGHADFDYFRLCDTPLVNDESLHILNAAFDGDRVVRGVKGEKFELSIHMDALPAGDYRGIYLSMPIPAPLIAVDVLFSHDNIKGQTHFNVVDGHLFISVTGKALAFSHHTSGRFATLLFQLDDYVPLDETLCLRPDYIYVDAGHAAYLIHDMQSEINIRAIDSGANAKLLGFANPLISHKFGADPWALEYDGRLYLYLTGDTSEYDDFGRLSENTYNKINTINLISSADLLNWTDHGAISVAGAKGAAAWAEYAWAPSVAYKNVDGADRFFLYFANNSYNIGVLVAPSPTGPFSDPLGAPLIHRGMAGIQDVIWCFDPAVLIDDDGSAYLYFGGGLPSHAPKDVLHPGTARVIRLGDDMISTVGPAITIDAPAFYVDSGIHKHNGCYYYSYCSNFIGTHPVDYPGRGEIAYMTAAHPLGPFTYTGSILNNPSSFFGAGEGSHHCVFRFKDEWYLAYQAQTLSKALGRLKGYRSPHINRLYYHEDGQIQPVLADMKGVALPGEGAINPYAWTQATTFAWCKGVSVHSHFVSHIHNGDWLAVANVDFGDRGATCFNVRVASLVGGEIEIRVDDPQKEAIGILGVGVTGGEDVWAIRSCELSPICGVRTLFFFFHGDFDGALFHFDAWMFE